MSKKFQMNDSSSLQKVLKLNNTLEEIFDSTPESVGFLSSADVWSLMMNLCIYARFHLKEPHFSRRQANAELQIETIYDPKSKNAGMVSSRKKRSGTKPIWIETEPESLEFLDLIYEVVSKLRYSPERFQKILQEFFDSIGSTESASEKQTRFSATLSKRRATIGYFARQYAKSRTRRQSSVRSILQNKSSK